MGYTLDFSQLQSRYDILCQWQPAEAQTYEPTFQLLDAHLAQWKEKENAAQKTNYFLDCGMLEIVLKIFQWQVAFDLDKSRLVAPGKQLPQTEILIQLVGFSPEPLLLSTLTLQPQKLYLLYSKETADMRNRVVEKLVENDFAESRIHDTIPTITGDACEINSSDPQDVISVIEKVNEAHHSESITIDITGGKKTMVAGAFLTATKRKFDVYYVDHEAYYDTLALPGSEYLRRIQM